MGTSKPIRVGIPLHTEGFILDRARIVQIGPYHHDDPPENATCQAWIQYRGEPSDFDVQPGEMLYVLNTVDELFTMVNER